MNFRSIPRYEKNLCAREDIGHNAFLKVLAKKIRWKYDGVLPQKAVVGLWNALVSCSKNPKILQSQADQV